ncbi:hypothetical protein DS043_17440 [Escherichia coli]|nr:hypothetical protein [Escherichia coli]EFO4690223.1 hypothetical protein [Escherichia coli]EFO4699924.1 hypothetical protein [Escherichia coli]EFP9422845.1 hypothetical protein [Shigella dysenteriae]EFX8384398.1 hypothetical protein [Shigella dysenteriae]
MLKKYFSFILLLLALSVLLTACYIIGVLQSWKISSVFIIYISIIFVATIVYFILPAAKNWVSMNFSFFKSLLRYRFFRKESAVLAIFRRGIYTLTGKVKKKEQLPWYILTKHNNNNNIESSLMRVKSPLFKNTDKNSFYARTGIMKWWFFRNICILSISEKLLASTADKNSIKLRKKLFSLMKRNKLPDGIIIIFPVSVLMNADQQQIQQESLILKEWLDELCQSINLHVPVYLILDECTTIDGFSYWDNQLSKSGYKHDLSIYWPDGYFTEQNRNEENIEDAFSYFRKTINCIRITLMENAKTRTEQQYILNFPENMILMEKNLMFLLSMLCQKSAYHPAINLRGVCFSDTASAGDTWRYMDFLLSERLPELAKQKKEKKYKSHHKLLVTLLISLHICLFSCVYWTYRITSGSDNESPDLLADNIIKYDAIIKNKPLRYTLLLPVFYWHRYKDSEKLRHLVKFNVKPISEIITNYREEFRTASSENKKEMILSLARVLRIQDMIRDHEFNFDDVNISIPKDLRLTDIQYSVSHRISLLIERSAIVSNDGSEKVEIFRDLLNEFLLSDKHFSWLLVPPQDVPDLQITTFWPEVHNDTTLSGIWRAAGQKKISDSLDLLKTSSGDPLIARHLRQFWIKLPELRQDAWGQFILAVVTRTDNLRSSVRTTGLSEISRENTPEDLFFKHLITDLEDIPDIQAQTWLRRFRQLMYMKSISKHNRVIRFLQSSELSLRTRFFSVFSGQNELISGDTLQAWRNWQDSLYRALDEATNEIHTGDYLIRGLFYKSKDQKTNPLISTFKNLDILRRSLYSGKQDTVTEALWKLYERRAYYLLENAISRAGYWLNEQWKQRVLLPVEKKGISGDKEQEQETYQYVLKFLHGPAKGLVNLNINGAKAATFRHHSFPFNREFTDFIFSTVSPDDFFELPLARRFSREADIISLQSRLDILTDEQKKLEKQEHQLMITSAPVTIPERARVMPVGSSLKLKCSSGNSILDSFNLADSSVFVWKAGQCSEVNIDIMFPAFKVSYVITGYDAWPKFLNIFSEGEAELPASDFLPESEGILRTMKINSILARFSFKDMTGLMSAYDEWSQIQRDIETVTNEYNSLLDNDKSAFAMNKNSWLQFIPENIISHVDHDSILN